MSSTQHLVGAVLFVLGVVALFGSWTVSGTVAAVVGLAAVALLSSGTVLVGMDRRTDEPPAA